MPIGRDNRHALVNGLAPPLAFRSFTLARNLHIRENRKTNSDEWQDWTSQQGALPDVATGDELDTYLEDILANIEQGIELGNSRDN